MQKKVEATSDTIAPDPNPAASPGFGTFQGVYIPSVLTIFGVILYLRMGWVVGSVGLLGSIVIITLSSAITFLTALSISATATNMKVKGGGAYYIISRSFGVEAGAAIGLPLYFAQALGVSFYLTGFAEAVTYFSPNIHLKLVAGLSLLMLSALAFFSTDLALKTQYIVFAIIAASIISFLVGGNGSIPADQVQAPTEDAGFWLVFAVFFPAVTGIEAGISMSGDLKNPARSLPLGTVGAVVSGFVVYLIIAIVLYQRVPEHYLLGYPLVVEKFAWSGVVVLIGLLGASLSSGLGALMGAPRTLQALARDRIVPKQLAKGSGPQDSPRIATAITFLISGCGILMGNLDQIAQVLSMFFLTSYGVLNLAAGMEGLIGNPSWRPKFSTPWYLSLIGAAGCLLAMLMIDPGATIIASLVVGGVYFIMLKRNFRARWSDMRASLLSALSRYSIYQLAQFSQSAKTWRPHMLVLSGSPSLRWYLVELAHAITHGKGFLTFATVCADKDLEQHRVDSMENGMKEFLSKRGISALVKIHYGSDPMKGAMALVKDYGLGPLFPNTIVLGDTEKTENFYDFSKLVQKIYRSGRNVLIVREPKKSKDSDDGSTQPQIDVTPQAKEIDVWWGRQRQNAGLMMAMAYMLQTSPSWRGSVLNLKSLVETEDQRQGAIDHLQEFIAEGRLAAELKVYVGSQEEEPLNSIRKYSKDSDLVFIGMRPPEEGETLAEYTQYYSSLVERTEKFPRLVITLASENINFSEIFE